MMANHLVSSLKYRCKLLTSIVLAGTLVLAGCDDKPDYTADQSDQAHRTPERLPPQSAGDGATRHDIDLSGSGKVLDLSPPPPVTQTPPMALTEPEDDVVLRIQQMSGTPEDVATIETLLPDKTISADAKQEMISLLQTGERDDVIRALGIALQDRDPDVAASAVEAISMVGNSSDIPLLKKVRESTEDEALQSAIDDAISFLEE